MDANKKICLDEVSARFLCSLKTERVKLGMSRMKLAQLIGCSERSIFYFECLDRIPPLCWLIKLSEIFCYDLSGSVNYKYWHGKIQWHKLREQKTYYGFTYDEMSGYIGYSATTLHKALWQREDFSLDCLNAILGIFEDERRLLDFRKELLSVRERKHK